MKYILLALLAVFEVVYITLHLKLHGYNFWLSYFLVGLVAGMFNYLSANKKKRAWGILGFFIGPYGVLIYLITIGILNLKESRNFLK